MSACPKFCTGRPQHSRMDISTGSVRGMRRGLGGKPRKTRGDNAGWPGRPTATMARTCPRVDTLLFTLPASWAPTVHHGPDMRVDSGEMIRSERVHG